MRALLVLGICILAQTAMAGVPVPPSITVQPKNVTVVAPAAATFTVTAKGSAPLTYQWQQSTDGGANFTDIPAGAPFTGQTTRSLRLNPSNSSLSGRQFRCIVTNGAGTVTSAIVVLVVNDRPTITVQPVSQMILVGTPATFAVTAGGTGPLAYQWKKNNRAIAGETNPTFTIPAVATTDAGTYTVTITGPGGTVTSKGAKLTPATAPAITVQPLPKGVVAPGAASFTVTATGTAPLTYQWQQSADGVNFTNIPVGAPFRGQTTRALSVSPTTLALNATTFRCVVTNGVGQATSNGALLTVGQRPALTTQPANVAVQQGQPAMFTVVATGTAPLAYQWKKNNVVLPGQTAATLNLPAVTGTDAGTYTVVVSNPVGTLTSKGAKLTVATPPEITTQPVNMTVTAPVNVIFRVLAKGTGPLTYHWQTSTDGGGTWGNLANGPGISGVTTPNLTLRINTADLSGHQFRCVVTNPVGTVTSNAVTLVINIRPAITTQPLTQGMPLGGTGSLTVVANGTNLAYQWKKNGQNLPGQNAATLTFPIVDATTAGTYTVVVSNNIGTVTSRGAVVTVGTPPSITTQPMNLSNWVEGSFTLTAAGSATLTYHWQVSTNGGTNFANVTNNSSVSGAATSTLSFFPLNSAQNGQIFRCLVKNNFGTATSTPVTLTVVPLGDPPFNWAAQAPNNGLAVGFTQFYSVTNNGTVFVAVGANTTSSTNGSPLVEISTNGGVGWQLRTAPGAGGLNTVTWGGNKFVAGGDGGLLLTSPNGSQWTQRVSNTTFNFSDLDWTGAQFIGLVNNSTVTQNTISSATIGSPDGVNWTVRSIFQNFIALGFANTTGRYVIVGQAVTNYNTDPVTATGAIIFSTNGSNWSTKVPNAGLPSINTVFNSVAYANGLFVAVGTNGIIMTSPNGETWTQRNSTTNVNLNFITAVGSYFVVAGGAQTGPGNRLILYSPDGINWTNLTLPGPANTNSVLGLTWTPDVGVVAVGYNGTILTGAPNLPVAAPAADPGVAGPPALFVTPAGATTAAEDGTVAPAGGPASGGADQTRLFVLEPGLPVLVIRGQEYAAVTLVTEPDAVLAGRLLDAAGQPVAGAKVYAHAGFAGLPLAACAETDEQGAFRLGVIAGLWRVGTAADGGVNEISVVAETGKTAAADLTLP